MNLLFAINRNFTDLLCNCIRSIVKNGGADHYDAYILHSDLQDDNKTRINQVAGEKVTFHFITVDEAMFEGFPESNRYPKQIYYRLAAPLLLPRELDRILYLDVELMVINSLEELYHTDFEGNYYVACSHVKELLTKFNQLRLGVEEVVPYINTGVMVMNLTTLRENLTIEQIRETAQKKMHTFLLPDQDLLTVMHGERIKLVDTMRYNLSDRLLSYHNANPRNQPLDLQWVRKNVVIIHYYGKNKPWKSGYNGILDVFYHEFQT
ncbi:MAG: glycosyltransferase family 8 protein [Ruminococcaceae bacterium]|nr:glycosyltransferase family 8 protein [Oscillospiraceae bacterium]